MTATSQTLETILGHQFGDRRLLDRALTHRSWVQDQTTGRRDSGDNQQLEFLGDAILGFVVSEALFLAYPNLNEGQLTQVKAQFVCAAHLYTRAADLDIGRFLHLGRGEDSNGGRERKAILADAMEAIIAALFLDGGLEAARRFITHHLIQEIGQSSDVASLTFFDYKGVLQEQMQSRNLPMPRYAVVATRGPEHSKHFTVEVRVGNQFTSRGEGDSKKAASQRAAQALLQQVTKGSLLAEESTGESHSVEGACSIKGCSTGR